MSRNGQAPGELEVPVQEMLFCVIEWELEHVVIFNELHHVIAHSGTRPQELYPPLC